MLDILHDLEAYNGAQHSGVSWRGKLIASTFPNELQTDLSNCQHMVQHMFDGIRKCGHNYNEVHLELDRDQLLAYRLSDDCTLMLLTRKGVNMALMTTSVRSVRDKILHEAQANQKAELEDGSADSDQSLQNQEDAAALSQLMNKLCDKMVDVLGSPGAISFYRILNEWKHQYGMNKYKLPALLKSLSAELDAGQARDSFLKDAVLLTRELMQH